MFANRIGSACNCFGQPGSSVDSAADAGPDGDAAQDAFVHHAANGSSAPDATSDGSLGDSATDASFGDPGLDANTPDGNDG